MLNFIPGPDVGADEYVKFTNIIFSWTPTLGHL